jgi:creatinine amidohydrolase
MWKKPVRGWRLWSCVVLGVLFIGRGGPLAQDRKPLVLQEMTWTDVRDYLKNNDMVIIPLGSTEQHGPHLPLGTDCYESTGMAKMVSARTGVLVAPVLLVGYSVYHSGFPGSLSLKTETMTQVLFETAELLIGYGFRRIMFFNYHGGNRLAEQTVIHRINHTTTATAVAIGIGASFQRGPAEEPAPFDYHAGIGETSLMLYLEPELVKMERAERPKITFTPQMQELLRMGQKYPVLMAVLGTMQGVPETTGKGGASHELSSNGIWSMGDPQKATRELGEENAERLVSAAVDFIDAWKKLRK